MLVKERGCLSPDWHIRNKKQKEGNMKGREDEFKYLLCRNISTSVQLKQGICLLMCVWCKKLLVIVTVWHETRTHRKTAHSIFSARVSIPHKLFPFLSRHKRAWKWPNHRFSIHCHAAELRSGMESNLESWLWYTKPCVLSMGKMPHKGAREKRCEGISGAKGP